MRAIGKHSFTSWFIAEEMHFPTGPLSLKKRKSYIQHNLPDMYKGRYIAWKANTAGFDAIS